MLKSVVAACIFVCLAFVASAAVPLPVSDHFESAHVHSVELSADGTRLYVVHTADHKLSVFDLTGPDPVRIGQVAVGIEPVSVRELSSQFVWVVNHVSDSISIVDLNTMHVVATLMTGDEPTDVVFDVARNQAFVCVSQEDLIRVFDLTTLSAVEEIPLTMSDPWALEFDGNSVYVAALDSQNETTVVPPTEVFFGGGAPPPSPPMAGNLPDAPFTSLIVRYDGTAWRDEIGRSWNSDVPYTLHDHDVMKIDAASRAVVDEYRQVGTTLFNLALNPADGALWVANQEAFNEVRFEPNLKNEFVQTRVTKIDLPGGTVTPVHLNPHINYASPAGSAGERAQSLSIPVDLTFSAAGVGYVAAMGANQVGVLDSFGAVTRRIPVGEGPSGLALDEGRGRLYVVNRFTSTLSVVDLTDDSSYELPLGFDGSSSEILNGRKFLYDGHLSSAHGDLSCASCHIFGTMDNIGWDLGDPTGAFVPPANQDLNGFHPMKGPMTTQTLRGLTSTEPLHWRGDRDSFLAFNGTFPNLLGRSSTLSGSEMQAFEDFVMTMKPSPTPFRQINGDHLNSIDGADPARGESLFLSGNLVLNAGQCVDCHSGPSGENGVVFSAEALSDTQDFVVPQIRNMYEKLRFDKDLPTNVRGFGLLHDGTVDGLDPFLNLEGFTFSNQTDIDDVAAFVLAFESDIPAGLGAQWTMSGQNFLEGLGRVGMMVSEADEGRLGLIAKGRDAFGENRGYVYLPGVGFQPDRAAETTIAWSTLASSASSGQEVTFTAVHFGNETRFGVDQDGDGYFDRDELDLGTDPEDPGSTPVGVPTGFGANQAPQLALSISGANPTATESRLETVISRGAPVELSVFDLQGRRVRTLLSGPTPAGRAEHVWDLRDGKGRRVSSGVYFVRLHTGDVQQTQRVTVLR